MKDSLLGTSELTMMLAVLKRGNNAYGLQVQEELKNATGRKTTLGAIHTTMARLEEKGLIDSDLADESSDRLGRPRRYFKVTAAGIRACRTTQNALQKLGGLRPIFGLTGVAI